MRFLRLPWPVWGVVCLAVAALYTFVWPRPVAQASAWTYFVLRWAHALVWVLLALSCFVRGTRFGGAANPVAAAAGITYVVFLIAVVVNR